MTTVRVFRGRGYRRDPDSLPKTPLRAMAHRLGAAAQSADLSSFTPAILDQSQTGSCVGHALACAIFTSLSAQGVASAFLPSPADIYTLARCLERAQFWDGQGQAPPLADNGSQPYLAIRALGEWGIRPMRPLPERFSDADPATINDDPKLLDIEADSQSLIVGPYAVSSTDDVALALSNKIPVTAALDADSDAFQTYSGGTLGPLGTSLDHYVCITGFDVAPDGSRRWRVRNSWSSQFGVYGELFVNDAALAEFGDMYAIRARFA
jgi:hypothetical protein